MFKAASDIVKAQSHVTRIPEKPLELNTPKVLVKVIRSGRNRTTA